jgi:hypothetical protein
MSTSVAIQLPKPSCPSRPAPPPLTTPISFTYGPRKDAFFCNFATLLQLRSVLEKCPPCQHDRENGTERVDQIAIAAVITTHGGVPQYRGPQPRMQSITP